MLNVKRKPITPTFTIKKKAKVDKVDKHSATKRYFCVVDMGKITDMFTMRPFQWDLDLIKCTEPKTTPCSLWFRVERSDLMKNVKFECNFSVRCGERFPDNLVGNHTVTKMVTIDPRKGAQSFMITNDDKTLGCQVAFEIPADKSKLCSVGVRQFTLPKIAVKANPQP